MATSRPSDRSPITAISRNCLDSLQQDILAGDVSRANRDVLVAPVGHEELVLQQVTVRSLRRNGRPTDRYGKSRLISCEEPAPATTASSIRHFHIGLSLQLRSD
jgi:hypothetical protein